MNVLRLNQNSLNIQKCLLSDCEFLKENHGRLCLVIQNDCRILVRIGLCEIKFMNETVFLDNSVSLFSSFDKIKETQYLTDITFDNFIVLNRPQVAKSVKVVAVFNDVFDVKRYRNQQNNSKQIIQDILKLFTVCNNSLVSLKNLPTTQNFGISYIFILNVDNSKQNQIFKVNSQTEVCIDRCISRLKFEQMQEKESEIQVGGCHQVYDVLKEAIELSKCFDRHKLKLVTKLLLIGPSGCGKTTLVREVTNDCKAVLLKISASDVNALTPNDALIKLKGVFDKGKIYSETKECCVILIEDIDLMSVGRTSHSKQFVKQLITLLEDIENTPGVVVIATTNSPDEVDPQLRKPKRLEDELEIMIPTLEERKEIIQKILKYCKVEYDKDFIHQLSKWTPGFVGADLKLVVIEALMAFEKKQGLLNSPNLNLLQECFKEALKKVIPSALKGTIGLCTTKDTSFSHIGGLESIKKILDLSVKKQLENPEKFHKLGIPLTKGILLYGPPGCAKTTLVKALAKECNTTFIATSAADLYSPYVGDAEKKIVQLFSQARIGSPSILFIDEIDAVVGSKFGDRERGVQERILSTLLIEMDGVGLKVNTQRDNSLNLLGSEKKISETEINSGVIVIGATNRPQLLDDALKRPGRFDRLLYVPPPDESERLRILKKLTEKMALHESVDLNRIAKLTDFYSGADLKNLCQESGLYALKSSEVTAECICQSHFDHILSEYKPSLNEKVIGFYESFQKYNV